MQRSLLKKHLMKIAYGVELKGNTILSLIQK